MSVLKSILLKLRTSGSTFLRHTLCVVGWAYNTLPILLAVIASAFTVITAVVLVLMITYVDRLKSSVGIETTITILIGSIGLFISTIGVLIAALRYASERRATSKPLDRRK